jgi:hypothetical protein
MTAPEHVSSAVAGGIGFLAAGTLLLIQELGLFTLDWAMLVPGLLIALGLITLATGLVAAHRTSR